MTHRKTLSVVFIIVGFVIAIWGKFTLLFGLPFFVIGLILNWTTDRRLWLKLTLTILPIVLYTPSMLGFWYLKNKAVSQADTYIFPKGFHGQATIAFNISKGDKVKIENGRRVFSFDTSGLLLTQATDAKGIVDQQFYYKDSMGLLVKLAPYEYTRNTTNTNDSSTIVVFGWHEKGATGDKNCSYKFYDFKICSLSELDTIDNGFKSLKMHDIIKRKACGQ